MRKFYTCALIWALTWPVLQAQSTDFPADFEEKVEAAKLQITRPLDSGYETVPIYENPYQDYHYAIRSDKEDMEIRYYVLPYNEQDTLSMFPDVLCLRASSSVAVNDDEALMSMLPILRTELRQNFGADWGIIYFFEPKPDFTGFKHCRMLALHKEGIGSVLVFFLFDDPNNVAVDIRFPAVRFEELN
ncbi:MAG: hypothetical protein GYB31_06315 [Bacteroidetes bacterium]|nr:hypothetical protein [Bacteroidota bacterium]